MLQPLLKNSSIYLSRLLVVEDNPTDAALVVAQLGQAFPQTEVVVCANLAETIWALQQSRFDFLILDLNLPDSSGIHTLQTIISICPDVAILILSGHDDSELAKAALKLGAQDYLIKGRGTSDTIKRIVEYSMERKQIERQLVANEQMLSTFIRHSPAGIVVLDKELRIITASDRWLQAHELKDAMVRGEQISRLCGYKDNKWLDLFQQCLRAEHISCSEDAFPTKSGDMRYIRWEMIPWFDSAGQIGGIIKFHEDVTEQRNLRLALEEANGELEHKVQERTKELFSAMIVAESAQSAKDEFFANMTHELRTPLHAIINFSKFGIKKASTAPIEKLTEYFTDIHTSGNRLLGLVNDLLDLTKHKYGKTVIAAQTHSLAELCDGVISEMSAILESRNLKIVQKISPQAETASFDMRRVHQVLLNLVGNAIKFSDDHSTITIETSLSDQYPRLGGSYEGVVVSVVDQGMGIPEAELESVFDEFVQSTKVKNGSFIKGTGLGLAICRQIIQSHGGIIWAENGKDRGAVIRFVLPHYGMDSMAEQECV